MRPKSALFFLPLVAAILIATPFQSNANTFPFLDQTFGKKGTVILKGIHGTTGMITSNGNILIHGYSTGLNPNLAILKLSAKGKLINNYGTKGVSIIKLDKLNKNTVPEVFSKLIEDSSNNTYGFSADGSLGVQGAGVVVKLNDSGKLDLNFGSKGIFRFEIPEHDHTIFENGAFDSSGNIIVVGGSQKFGWENPLNPTRTCNYEGIIAKLNTNGILQTSFNNLGYLIFPFTPQNTFGNTCTTIRALSIDSNDNIYIATSVSTGSSKYLGIYLAKLDRNGNLVNEFGKNGIAKIFSNDNTYNIDISELVLKNEKIYLAGKKLRAIPNTTGVGNPNASKNSTEYINDAFILRLNSDGVLDESFGKNGFFINSNSPNNNTLNNLHIDESGNIYVGGTDTNASRRSVGSILNIDSSGNFFANFGIKGIFTYKYNSKNYFTGDSLFDSDGSMIGISIAENCSNCETHVKKFKLK